MKSPAKIRLSKPGFETYTGHLGPVHFTDGVSDDVVPFHLVNRIAASTPVEYLDETGKDAGQAGPAILVLQNALTRVEDIDALERQTEDERKREEQARALAGEKPPVEKFYTEVELDAVIDQPGADGGIKGLRKIAEPWGVKDKSIPGLKREILEAQGNFLRDRDHRRAAVGLPRADEAAALAAAADVAPAKEGQISGRLQRLIDIAGAASMADVVNGVRMPINEAGPTNEGDPDAADETRMRDLSVELTERQAEIERKVEDARRADIARAEIEAATALAETASTPEAVALLETSDEMKTRVLAIIAARAAG